MHARSSWKQSSCGLVGADPQDRVPRVIRRARAGHAGGLRLAFGVGRDQALEQARIQRTATTQVAHQQRRLRAGDRHAAVKRAQFDEQLLREEMPERERVLAIRRAGANPWVQLGPRPPGARQQIARRRNRQRSMAATVRHCRTVLPAGHRHRTDRSVGAGERNTRADLGVTFQRVQQPRRILVLARQDQPHGLAGAEPGVRRLGGRTAARDERHDPALHRTSVPLQRSRGRVQHPRLLRGIDTRHLDSQQILEPAQEGRLRQAGRRSR